jgi:hypothetical protein
MIRRGIIVVLLLCTVLTLFAWWMSYQVILAWGDTNGDWIPEGAWSSRWPGKYLNFPGADEPDNGEWAILRLGDGRAVSSMSGAFRGWALAGGALRTVRWVTTQTGPNTSTSIATGMVTLPLPVIFAVLLAYPALLLIRGPVRRRRRRRRGLCERCGYNLLGNTSRVCPECGTTTSSQLDRSAPRRRI